MQISLKHVKMRALNSSVLHLIRLKSWGLKTLHVTTMEAAGVPLVPGTGIVPDIETGQKWAAEIGYPVIIKATAGGGGKGIRVARTEEELVKGIEITQKEAAAAFGNPGVYLEKFIEYFRHCEIQVLADGHGNVVHLGERDCTVQRRMQKLSRGSSISCTICLNVVLKWVKLQ